MKVHNKQKSKKCTCGGVSRHVDTAFARSANETWTWQCAKCGKKSEMAPFLLCDVFGERSE